MNGKNNQYDVIIAGAGPAGATLGYELARRGIGVLILEKSTLPRYKPCGGGITVRARDLLDFEIDPVTDCTICDIHASLKFRIKGKRKSDKPLIYTVMRDGFDHFLVQKAREAGAVVLDGNPVDSIELSREHVTVYTVNGQFAGQVLAGADGVRSIVARHTALNQHIAPYAVGIEGEVIVPEKVRASWDSTIRLDLGNVAGGYGWVFPKKDHLSIGVCGPIKEAKNLKPYYRRFIDSLKLGKYEEIRREAHSISMRRGRSPLQQDRVMLLGDAAGLCDPLTGEGIYYAIKSARIAAPVIADYLQGNTPDLAGYQQEIDKEVAPELDIAAKAAKILTVAPTLGMNLVIREKRVWDAACCVLRGEKSYLDLKRDVQRFPAFNTALKIFRRLNAGK